jgi:hypothetical protein
VNSLTASASRWTPEEFRQVVGEVLTRAKRASAANA